MLNVEIDRLKYLALLSAVLQIRFLPTHDDNDDDDDDDDDVVGVLRIKQSTFIQSVQFTSIVL